MVQKISVSSQTYKGTILSNNTNKQSKSMENITEKQAISEKIMPTLRKLGLYKTAYFPIERLNVVNATIQKVEITTGMDFSYRTNRESGVIEVTRIK